MNVEEFSKQFGVNAPQSSLVGRSYFQIPKNLQKFISKRPAFAGKCIAHIRGPVLIPSIDFLQFIGKNARKKVVVNKDGAWLFICGRDIFGKSVVSSQGNPEVSDLVVILNEFNECLGYGTVIAPLTDKKIVVKRLFDIGDLLRRERKSKKVKAF